MEFATKQDFDDLRKQIKEDLKRLLSEHSVPAKKWYKTSEVKVLLNCSSGTLQNLQAKGELVPKKLGGTLYYSHEQLSQHLDD